MIPTPVTYLKLMVSEWGYSDAADENHDEYNRPTEYTNWTVEGICITDSNGYRTAGISGLVEPGETVFALVAVYSTGDSFGRHEGARLEFVDVFRNEEAAEAARKILDTEQDRMLEYRNDLGQVISFHPPWSGYFESLDHIQVHELVVSPKQL